MGAHSTQQQAKTGSELYNTEHKTTADELAKLPRDYEVCRPACRRSVAAAGEFQARQCPAAWTTRCGSERNGLHRD